MRKLLDDLWWKYMWPFSLLYVALAVGWPICYYTRKLINLFT